MIKILLVIAALATIGCRSVKKTQSSFRQAVAVTEKDSSAGRSFSFTDTTKTATGEQTTTYDVELDSVEFDELPAPTGKPVYDIVARIKSAKKITVKATTKDITATEQRGIAIASVDTGSVRKKDTHINTDTTNAAKEVKGAAPWIMLPLAVGGISALWFFFIYRKKR